MHKEAIECLKKEKEKLITYKDDCCIQAQKLIGTPDFIIWEKRREGMEDEIRSLQNTISLLKNLKLVAEGKCQAQSDNENWFYVEAKDGVMTDVISSCEKYNGNNIKIYIEGE